jgi:hypothetical protein
MASLVAVLFVGCGSATTQADKPGFVVAAAGGKTTVGTVRMAGTVTLFRADGRHAVIQRMAAEQDFEVKTAHLVMTTPLSEIDPSRDDIVITMVAIAGTSYQHIPGVALPAGKEWIRFDAGALGETEADRQSIGSGNPADGLQFLKGVRDAKPAGADEVRGVPTTKYTVTFDVNQLLDQAARGLKKITPEFQQSLDNLRDSMDVGSLPGAVWLDAEGRVRRLRYSLLSPPTEGSVRGVTNLEYFDFGIPLSITAPPDGTVAPFSSVRSALRQYFAELAARGARNGPV